MEGFFRSFAPIFGKYKIEIILISIALIISFISIGIYFMNKEEQVENTVSKTTVDKPLQPEKIYVDVAGAVVNPGVYEFNSNSRLKDVITKADGLNSDAEKEFFSRNFNLARFVTDQEKIYIPSNNEVINGIFTEPNRIVDFTSPVNQSTNYQDSSNQLQTTNNESQLTTNQLIGLNKASLEELDQLPGIGQATANKIIGGRPYKTVDELVSKKVVSKVVFEKIKNLVEIN